jgi:Holliday junction resolvasome RuvABC endonuclease subunit
LPNTPEKTKWMMAKRLMQTALVAGEWCGAWSALGYPVQCVDPHDVRKALVGKARPTDGEVKAWLDVAVDDIPQRTNTHTRDAAAVAIVGHRVWQVEGAADAQD